MLAFFFKFKHGLIPPKVEALDLVNIDHFQLKCLKR